MPPFTRYKVTAAKEIPLNASTNYTCGPLAPPTRLLMGPGPTMVESRIYEAMSVPIVSHVDAYFFEVVEDIRKMLQVAFGTENAFTMAVSGTGSAGMEAAVANVTEPGMKFAVFANGYFSDRMAEMAKRQGADVVRLEKPWGQVFSDEEARAFILKEKPQVVGYVQAETSTGAYQRGKAICETANEVDALTIADCVTSLAGMPVGVDRTGIDVAYSGTQKALSCPPGLAPLTLSARALDRVRARQSNMPTWYLDLRLLDSYYGESKRYHHTAPIPLFYALREALRLVMEEGLENRWRRHYVNHMAFVAAAAALGMEMHVAGADQLWTLHTPVLPAGVSDVELRKYLLARHGIEVLGGFGPLQGKVLRIGLMGASSTVKNIETLLRGLTEGLAEQGFAVPGDAVEAARAVWANPPQPPTL
ncbi:MAG: alanine--glyoxylate aminotransferase family protein [Bryobacterales bacterium]|nr:alanine--glyoxylate aminotransferase family protein [Bryobacterales bacterium]